MLQVCHSCSASPDSSETCCCRLSHERSVWNSGRCRESIQGGGQTEKELGFGLWRLKVCASAPRVLSNGKIGQRRKYWQGKRGKETWPVWTCCLDALVFRNIWVTNIPTCSIHLELICNMTWRSLKYSLNQSTHISWNRLNIQATWTKKVLRKATVNFGKNNK